MFDQSSSPLPGPHISDYFWGPFPGHRVPDESITPLVVHILYHPDSPGSAALAAEVQARLGHELTTFNLPIGPIPVHVGTATVTGLPQPPELTGDTSLIVILVDEAMASRDSDAHARVADGWAALIEDLLDRYPSTAPGNCAVLPIAVGPAAFTLTDHLTEHDFVRLDKPLDDRVLPDELCLQVFSRCLRLLAGKPVALGRDINTIPPADISICVSHRLGGPGLGMFDDDEKEDDDREVNTELAAIRAVLTVKLAALRAAHHDLSLGPWHDSRDLPYLAPDDDIEELIGRCAVMLAFNTEGGQDGRCRMEVMLAERLSVPVVYIEVSRYATWPLPNHNTSMSHSWQTFDIDERNEGDDPDSDATQRLRDTVTAQQQQQARAVLSTALLTVLLHRHTLAKLPTSRH